ncbi:MAG: RcpC/CpaB family pilus assembly protein [Clostridia bacterium]|nr:RcpC/CpaB family pilus assembly protein [Clostridia bacterium]
MSADYEKNTMDDIQGLDVPEEEIAGVEDAEDDIVVQTRRGKQKRRMFVTPKLLIAILCIVVSLFIVFGLQPVIDNLLSKRIDVVLVKENIVAGELITKDNVEVVAVLDTPIAENFCTTMDEVINNYAAVDMFKGDTVTKSKVSPTIPLPNPFFYELKDGELAIACSVTSLASSVANKVLAGDVVTVYATYKNATGDGEAVEVPALKYVRVLSVTVGDTESKQNDDGSEATITVVTFLANSEQARILADLEANAAVHLAVVERGDTERALRYLEAQKEYFNAAARAEAEAAAAEAEDAEDE